jgi:signal transduction histidine kinase
VSAPSPPSLTSPSPRALDATRSRVQLGLRLQIVLALAGLMLLAFVPLFFAVASLTRATLLGARIEAARELGRGIAVHVDEAVRRARVPAHQDARDPAVDADAARNLDADATRAALTAHVGKGGVDAICAFENGGALVACVGRLLEGPGPLVGTAGRATESVEMVRGTTGRTLQVVSVAGSATVVTRVNVDADADRGTPLVRLVALYMLVFALALLVFAYFSLTRLIVRPVEHLVDAADRVANGARTLRVRRSGPRELAELGASVQAMAEKLIAEEAALILKVEELTETTKRLTETRAQLVRSERMASVGHLAAGLAHEIGNPIAALMGMEDLLLEGGLDAEAQRDFLQRMRRETDRIHIVVRDLLDFARPEGRSGGDAGPPVPAEVGGVIEDVLALVKHQKPFRAVQIDTLADPDLEVALPASKLTQVLLNLVLNAGAALASQGDADGVGSSAGAARIVIRARAASPGRVRIEVEDNGPGIAPSVRDRLFEPFVTTKQVGEGTGLGLAVCRGLVESAGGDIGADPSHETGALFYVELPSSDG